MGKYIIPGDPFIAPPISHGTVDGRNHAPVEVGSLSIIYKVFCIPSGAGFLPSTVAIHFDCLFVRLFCKMAHSLMISSTVKKLPFDFDIFSLAKKTPGMEMRETPKKCGFFSSGPELSDYVDSGCPLTNLEQIEGG